MRTHVFFNIGGRLNFQGIKITARFNSLWQMRLQKINRHGCIGQKSLGQYIMRMVNRAHYSLKLESMYEALYECYKILSNIILSRAFTAISRERV